MTRVIIGNLHFLTQRNHSSTQESALLTEIQLEEFSHVAALSAMTWNSCHTGKYGSCSHKDCPTFLSSILCNSELLTFLCLLSKRSPLLSIEYSAAMRSSHLMGVAYIHGEYMKSALNEHRASHCVFWKS